MKKQIKQNEQTQYENELMKLREALVRSKAHSLKMQKIARYEEEERKKRRKMLLKKEEELLPKKIELSEQIFEWGDCFRESFEYLEIISIKKSRAYSPTTENETLTIFKGGWGHKKRNGIEYWSNLDLINDGSYSYEAGYKWMGVVEGKKLFTSVNVMANYLRYEYLKSLSGHITTGTVFQLLASRLLSNINMTINNG